jgi:ribosome-binding protein aMBF1 (putative translation factor)
MGKCELCGKNGDDLSLLSANHKDRGYVMVCRDCWVKLYDGNRMVCGTTGSGGSCPTCG